MKHFRQNALLIIAILSSTVLMAQSGIVPAGGDAIGSSGSLSYSVGQVDYLVTDASAGKSNQGLQVPWEITVESGVENISIELVAKVHPNPVSDVLQLSIGDLLSEDMKYWIYDIQGKLIMESSLYEEKTGIDFSHLAASTYILHITSGQKIVKSFRIVKKH